MKREVAVLVEPRRFVLQEEKIELEEEQVLVKIVACGLCSWEIFHFIGQYGNYPQKIGHEPVGVIVEVGKKVKNFKTGDRVTGLFGPGFATYAVAYPNRLIKVPREIDTECALGEPLKCIATIARAANPEFGDYVLILGCGFMGLLTLAGISADFLAEVIAVDFIDSKLRIAQELGATKVFNPKGKDVEKEVMKITHGRGIDVGIDATGKPGAVDLVSKLMRSGRAKLLIVSSHSLPETCNLSYWERGMVLYSPQPGYSLDEMDDMRRGMIALQKNVLPIKKLITHRFPLAQIQQAFETLWHKPPEYIKGIVVCE